MKPEKSKNMEEALSRNLICSITVPARDAAACLVKAGQSLRVVDVEGQQIGDLVCFSHADPREKLSTGETLNFNNWTNRIRVESTLRSNLQRRMLTVTADTSGGFHDISFASCSALFYEEYGGGSGHANCRDNLSRSLAKHGLERVDVPDPVNLFQYSQHRPDGTIDVQAPRTRAGDYIEFLSEMDLIVAVSSCPFDLDSVGDAVGGGSTPLRLEIYEDQ